MLINPNIVSECADLLNQSGFHQQSDSLLSFFHALNTHIAEMEMQQCNHKNTIDLQADAIRHLRGIFNTSPDLIYYRNTQGQFVGCNKAMERLTGKKEATLQGKTPWDVYPPDIADLVVKTDKKVLESRQPLYFEQWLECATSKKEAFFEISKTPFFSEQGEYLGLVGFGRESTERKKAQEILEKTTKEKTQFILTISHELRTPLNAIVGLSRILLDTRLTQQQSEYLHSIFICATSLGHIFSDVIDIDKLDRNKLRIANTRTDMQAFLSDVANIGQMLSKQKNLTFSLSCRSPLPDFLNLDVTRLHQILWNLISNAVKFTSLGSVMIDVDCITLAHCTKLIFRIKDTGIGIDQKNIEKIFTMYYQVLQEDVNLRALGTGIGLAIARELARKMGGDIVVTSELQKGSEFTLTLEAGNIESESQSPSLSSDFSASYPDLNILLVEDVAVNITIVTELLKKIGCRYQVARTGEEALSYFVPQKAQDDPFDLILLDIQLPDMSGFDVAKAVKAQDGSSSHKIPKIVALTANTIKEKTDYSTFGIDDVLGKPFEISDFFSVIQAIKVSHDKPSETAVLDLPLLHSYVDMLTLESINQMVNLFEQHMPDYFSDLETQFTNNNKQAIVNCAHKIKGAAGTVGLNRIQDLANKMQNLHQDGDEKELEACFLAMKQGYDKDLNALKHWLTEQQLSEQKKVE